LQHALRLYEQKHNCKGFISFPHGPSAKPEHMMFSNLDTSSVLVPEVPARNSFWEHETHDLAISIILTTEGFRSTRRLGVSDRPLQLSDRPVQLSDIMCKAPYMSLEEREALFTAALITITNDFDNFAGQATGDDCPRSSSFACMFCCS
jgi:hypothetical protein